MTRRRWASRSKWGGQNSEFWRGRYRWRAFNEGGRHATLNLVLRDGWLPVAAYVAVNLPLIGFVHAMPRWQKAGSLA